MISAPRSVTRIALLIHKYTLAVLQSLRAMQCCYMSQRAAINQWMFVIPGFINFVFSPITPRTCCHLIEARGLSESNQHLCEYNDHEWVLPLALRLFSVLGQ